MAFEQKNNSGSLFKNERKETESQPTHTGSVMVDGKEYYISAWVKTGKNDTRFFSLAFKPKGEPTRGGGGSNLDDDVGF